MYRPLESRPDALRVRFTDPHARRRERTDRECPSTTGKLKRHPAAQRVARQMRLGEPQLVQHPLKVVQNILDARRSTAGEPTAVVSQHGRDDDILLA